MQAVKNRVKEIVLCVQKTRSEALAEESQNELVYRSIELLNKDEERYPVSTFNMKRIEDVLHL